ncbi:hypothetical protein U1Q18_035132 [Sarracenia purpurea var. burkii]
MASANPNKGQRLFWCGFPARGSPMAQLWPVLSLSGGKVQNCGGGAELAGDFREQDNSGKNFARYSTEAWIWQISEDFGEGFRQGVSVSGVTRHLLQGRQRPWLWF